MNICAEIANRVSMEYNVFRFNMLTGKAEDIYNSASEIVMKNDIDYFFTSMIDLPKDCLYVSEDVLKTLLTYDGNLLNALYDIYVTRDCMSYEDIPEVVEILAESIKSKE